MMFTYHGNAIILYIVGIVMMMANLAQGIFCKQGNFFNPPEMELQKERRVFIKMRVCFVILQTIMLIMYIVCAIFLRSYGVAFIALVIGNFLPIGIIYACDALFWGKKKSSH